MRRSSNIFFFLARRAEITSPKNKIERTLKSAWFMRARKSLLSIPAGWLKICETIVDSPTPNPVIKYLSCATKRVLKVKQIFFRKSFFGSEQKQNFFFKNRNFSAAVAKERERERQKDGTRYEMTRKCFEKWKLKTSPCSVHRREPVKWRACEMCAWCGKISSNEGQCLVLFSRMFSSIADEEALWKAARCRQEEKKVNCTTLLGRASISIESERFSCT